MTTNHHERTMWLPVIWYALSTAMLKMLLPAVKTFKDSSYCHGQRSTAYELEANKMIWSTSRVKLSVSVWIRAKAVAE